MEENFYINYVILLSVAWPVNMIYKDITSRPVTHPARTVSELRNEYTTDMNAENDRHKVVIDAISKKYNVMIEALKAKQSGFIGN